MNKPNVLLFLFFFIVTSCNQKKKNNNLSKIEIYEKEIIFNDAAYGDTIIGSFKIKNTSKNKLNIKNISTSCGCTTVGIIDSIINFNETVIIKAQYIPKKNEIGLVTNSVVVEMNTEPPFTIFRLKGNVIR